MRNLLFIVLSLSPLVCFAQEVAPARAQAIDAAIMKVMEEQQVVGAAVGVIRGGRVVYLKGFGEADREKHLPVTNKTVFNWASNSKPIAAVLVMKLVEEGMLDLDEDVRRYVPEYPDPGFKITCRHILAHHSGVPHYSNGKIVGSSEQRSLNEFVTPLNAIKVFDRSPLLFEPGLKFSYSSYAFVLLSAVIEAAGKKTMQEQLDEVIIKPLELKSFVLDLPEVQAEWSKGYEKSSDGDRIVVTRELSHAWKHGAGAYKSNIEDFARWGLALTNHELLKPETYELMQTPQKLNDGTKSSYGLGLAVSGEGRMLRLSHSGKQNEATSQLVVYPNAGTAVVVLTNSSHASPEKFVSAVSGVLNGK